MILFDWASAQVSRRPPRTHVFDSLPAELVCLILNGTELWIPEERYDCRIYYTSIQDMRSVSRRWRDILDGLPQLWVYISSDMSEDLRRLALRLSAHRTLDIFCGLDKQDLLRRKFLDFYNDVREHRRRWRLLEIDAPEWDDVMAHIVTDECESLQELAVEIKDQSDSDVPMIFGNLLLPKLKALRLRGCTIPIEHPAYHTLEELMVTGTNNEGPFIGSDEFFAWLMRMPQLASLILEYGGNVDPSPTEDFTGGQLVLPRLKTLRLVGIDSTTAAQILDFAVKPMDELSINCPHLDLDTSLNLARLYASHRPRVTSIPRFDHNRVIAFVDKRGMHFWGTGWEGFSLSMVETDVTPLMLGDILRTLLEALDQQERLSLEHVTAQPFAEYGESNAVVLRVLGQFLLRVHRLHVQGGEFAFVADAFAPVTVDDAEVYPFPSLRSIYIAGRTIREGSLLRLVQGRSRTPRAVPIADIQVPRDTVSEAELAAVRELGSTVTVG